MTHTYRAVPGVAVVGMDAKQQEDGVVAGEADERCVRCTTAHKDIRANGNRIRAAAKTQSCFSRCIHW